MGIKLQGGNNSTNLTSVNALHQLQVVTPQDSSGLSAGFAQLSTEVDAGDVLGYRTVIALEGSDDYRLRVGMDQTVFNATFEGLNILHTQWNTNTLTFLNQIGLGFYTLNATALNTSGAASYVRTWRHFPAFGSYPLYVDMWIRENATFALNAISEWGLLYLTSNTTQQPIDGIYFRRISGGKLKGVITNANIDIAEVDFDTTNVPSRHGYGPYDPTEVNHYLISFQNDAVRFWINDVVVGELFCPSQVANFTASSNLPVGFRVLNGTSTATAARVLSIGCVNVGLGDQNVGKPWSHAMVGHGQGSYQNQIGNAPGPTVTRTNGAHGHPASNTARIAGSYVQSSGPSLNSLGGLWTSPAMSTLTTEFEYPIFSYLNPIGTVTGISTIPGKTLYVTGIRIGETIATVGATGGGGMFLSYIAMPDSSGSSLATTDGTSSTSGKSIVLGGQGFATGDPVGTMKPGFDMSFPSPLVIPAGKYLLVGVRLLGTTALNTLVVTGSVAVNGYFE